MTLRAPNRRPRPRSLVFDAILRAKASALILGQDMQAEAVLAAVAERMPEAKPLDLRGVGATVDLAELRGQIAERLERHPALVAVFPQEVSNELRTLVAEVVRGEFVAPNEGGRHHGSARIIGVWAVERPEASVAELFSAQLSSEDVVSPAAPERARRWAR